MTKGRLIALIFIAALALAGVVFFVMRGSLRTGLSWLTLWAWVAVIVKGKGKLKDAPMTDARLKVRRLYSRIFVIFGFCWLGMAAWGTSLELARIVGPFYDGTIVAFDNTHPNPAGWEDPIVRVTGNDGKTVVFSNYGVYAQPTGQHTGRAKFFVGEHIRVIHHDGRYEALIFNNALEQELGLLAITLTAVAVCWWAAFSFSRSRTTRGDAKK